MGRPRGSRNADYHIKRQQLARKVAHTLVDAPSDHVSLRELARAADVSVSTMRHYFDDRAGLVQAAIAEMGATAQRYLADAVDELEGPPAERLATWLCVLVDAWTRYRVGRAHAVGLAEGLYADTGPAYVQHLVQPFFDATGSVLARLEREGHAVFVTRDHAVTVLLAPVQSLLEQQESLGADQVLCVDLEAFIDDHVARFLVGWADQN